MSGQEETGRELVTRECRIHGHVEVERFYSDLSTVEEREQCPVPTYQEEPCGEPLGPERSWSPTAASGDGEREGRSEAAQMLAEFEGHPNSRPAPLSLRLTLHREEHRELERELELGEVDRACLARELADVLYVAYGTASAFEIDLDAALREVHRAAMDKMEANVRRHDGKILKPPGFVPPDMTAALAPAPPSGETGGRTFSCPLCHRERERGRDHICGAAPPAGETGGERRYTLTVDADGEPRGLGDIRGSLPPNAAKGLRVIEVVEPAPSTGETGDGRELREWVLSADIGTEGNDPDEEPRCAMYVEHGPDGPWLQPGESVRVREIPSEGARA